MSVVRLELESPEHWVPRVFHAGVFPVLAVYLPFDACASILDGSLLGAGKQAVHHLHALP
jgi:hypothetical protein